jgi:hypothetical protein
MRRTLLLPLLPAVVALGSCADSSTSTSEPLETSSAAIASDTNDVDLPTRNASLNLFGDNDTGCSGILITPLWLLTANHCVTGDSTLGIGINSTGWGLNDSVEVEFGPTSTNGTIYTITQQPMGGTSPYLWQPFKFQTVINPVDTENDIALGELQTRPTPSFNVTAVPPFDVDASNNVVTSCPDSFFGLFSGYGGGSSPQRKYI